MSVRFQQMMSRAAALRLAFNVVALVSAAASAHTQVAAPRAGILRPGLIVDAVAGVGYVMAPNGGVAAVDLTSGATRWTSTAGAKPLALVGNLLVAQAQPRTQSNRLEVVRLRTQERGELASRDTVVLPAGVQVSVGETIHGEFDLRAEPAGADVILHWRFVPAPKRGMEEPDTLTRAQAAPARPVIRRGALRVRVATRGVTILDTNRVAPPREPPWIVPTEGKVAGAAAQQYESADGRHIAASERVGDDRVWEKYRWTVYTRAGQRLGELRSHISFTPFVVRDSLVVFETTPYERAGAAPEPAKLRAFSLTSGREVWSVPVRENVYRGPYPP
jgi:hypothetical protein